MLKGKQDHKGYSTSPHKPEAQTSFVTTFRPALHTWEQWVFGATNDTGMTFTQDHTYQNHPLTVSMMLHYDQRCAGTVTGNRIRILPPYTVDREVVETIMDKGHTCIDLTDDENIMVYIHTHTPKDPGDNVLIICTFGQATGSNGY